MLRSRAECNCTYHMGISCLRACANNGQQWIDSNTLQQCAHYLRVFSFLGFCCLYYCCDCVHSIKFSRIKCNNKSAPFSGNESRLRRKHLCLLRRRLAHVTAEFWSEAENRNTSFSISFWVRVNDYEHLGNPQINDGLKDVICIQYQSEGDLSAKKRWSKGFRNYFKKKPNLAMETTRFDTQFMSDNPHLTVNGFLPEQFSIWLNRVKMRRRNNSSTNHVVWFHSILHNAGTATVHRRKKINFFPRSITGPLCVRCDG